MSYPTKQAAQIAANKVLAAMVTKGWEVRVWENLGWHWSLFRGGLSLNMDRDGEFWTLLSEDGKPPAGSYKWHSGEHFVDPNEAVIYQLKLARAYITRMEKVVSEAEALHVWKY